MVSPEQPREHPAQTRDPQTSRELPCVPTNLLAVELRSHVRQDRGTRCVANHRELLDQSRQGSWQVQSSVESDPCRAACVVRVWQLAEWLVFPELSLLEGTDLPERVE